MARKRLVVSSLTWYLTSVSFVRKIDICHSLIRHKRNFLLDGKYFILHKCLTTSKIGFHFGNCSRCLQFDRTTMLLNKSYYWCYNCIFAKKTFNLILKVIIDALDCTVEIYKMIAVQFRKKW